MSRPLSRNVLVNLVNAGASVGLAAVTVPLALHYLGLSGFGVWTLAQTALLYIATAETGFGPAVQRYVSVAHGATRMADATRVVWSAAAFYLVLGAAAAFATAALAPTLVDLFDVPAAMRDDAVEMFRIIGVVMILALLAGGLANVVQGLERFVAATVATAVTSVVFLAVATALLIAGHGLRGLALAALAQQLVGVVLRVWMVRDVFTAARPGWVSRAEARELIAFSARLQVSVVSVLVNSQTDKVIVGLIANTAAVGAVGIASQAAEGVRFLIGAAVGPVMARLAVVHGQGDQTAMAAIYARLGDIWVRLNIGIVALATALIPPVLTGWVGDREDAALFAVVLTFGYTVSTLPTPGTAYLRAVGRPGIEARYAAGVIASNIVLSVVLGLLFGPIGVVSATTVAYCGGTVWLALALRGNVPPLAERLPFVRLIATAVLTAAAAAAWGVLMAETLPRLVSLVPIGIGAAAALAIYLSLATGGVRNLRTLMA